ncbi:hypothetical protein THASP1DRAFT_33881 [Thamnocephalis sphaerospora]|uniref:DNA 3'-5' helicase n=1 Tax=Thamnocephalis sphaerospora TaxID=78915 RepID=A0A4P9XFJ8_9FUNG|nr:hypothetical protein THASP1DRAFT_33881 [Thamnocephalis sphaerospora]|eukprot:RKP04365.1 hypothetical protein THASP1DRAFT_33881 [Thamnocephalis sphaerospora]
MVRTLWQGERKLSDEQTAVVKSILRGERTLFAASPPAREDDICYQLPAYICASLVPRSLTLVVVPNGPPTCTHLDALPTGMNGACLHRTIQAKEYALLVKRLIAGSVKMLFITADRVVSPSFQSLLGDLRMPPVRFVCIQGAHAILPQSSAFRASYARLLAYIKTRQQSCRLLAMTNVVMDATVAGIASSLEIGLDSISAGTLKFRRNVCLSVDEAEDKDAALLAFLRRSDMAYINAILVYAMRQADVNRIAGHLNTNDISAVTYHAGMSPEELERVEYKFACGKARVMVATAAMQRAGQQHGLRGLIHYHMPESVERYLFDIGTIGADGRPEPVAVQRFVEHLFPADLADDRCKTATRSLLLNMPELEMTLDVDRLYS